jgi:hypothetical protein
MEVSKMSDIKVVDVTTKYSREISDMAYKLKQLEDEMYYEKTGAKMDGSLATNIIQLRKMIIELITKIEYGKESVNDSLSELFGVKKL